MDELNPTVREQEIYEEMELTPEMIKSIRTLCATCLRHFVDLHYRQEPCPEFCRTPYTGRNEPGR